MNTIRDASTLKGRSPRVVVSIQYLRGLAAVLVVYFHTQVYLPAFGWHVDRSFGYGGVDIFFVISGFIMTITNSPTPRRPFDFFVSRFKRIYPLYWIALTASFMLYVIYPAAFNKVGVDIVYVIASYTLLPFQNLAGTSEGVPFLNIAWTLVFEIYFYAVFGISLMVRGGSARLILPAGFIGAMVAYGAIAEPKSAMLMFYTQPMALEFIFGCFVATFVERQTFRLPRAVLLLLLGVSTVGFLVGGGPSTYFMRVLSFGVPAAGIVLFAALHERLYGPIIQSRWLRVLGDASYSIYLVHPFVLTGLRVVSVRARLPFDTAVLGGIGVCVAVVVSVVVGVVMHFYVEKPAIALADRLIRRAIGGHSRVLGKLSETP